MRGLVVALVSRFVALAAAPSARRRRAPQAAIPPELALDRTLPIDPAVKTGRLPNGLRYFIRQNERPANRVAMRLAVNAGAIQEDADQRGLAHFLEHMAFNGTEHFKPGELVSFLESIGARFGPHVNASTSFDETIYMLEIPTDQAGLRRSRHDWCCRISPPASRCCPAEVEKERGVVLEEWRGRLGAGSRLTDKQLPVIFQGSRYAERLPIGLPEILKNAPRERLRRVLPEVVSPRSDGRGRRRRHPGRRGREAGASQHFGGIPAAKGAAGDGRHQRARAQGHVDQHVDRSGSAGLVGVGRRSRARPSTTKPSRGYRKTLVENLLSQMFNLRLRDIARRPNAPFLGAQAGTSEHWPLARAVRARSGRCPKARSPRASAR